MTNTSLFVDISVRIFEADFVSVDPVSTNCCHGQLFNAFCFANQNVLQQSWLWFTVEESQPEKNLILKQITEVYF